MSLYCFFPQLQIKAALLFWSHTDSNRQLSNHSDSNGCNFPQSQPVVQTLSLCLTHCCRLLLRFERYIPLQVFHSDHNYNLRLEFIQNLLSSALDLFRYFEQRQRAVSTLSCAIHHFSFVARTSARETSLLIDDHHLQAAVVLTCFLETQVS